MRCVFLLMIFIGAGCVPESNNELPLFHGDQVEHIQTGASGVVVDIFHAPPTGVENVMVSWNSGAEKMERSFILKKISGKKLNTKARDQCLWGLAVLFTICASGYGLVRLHKVYKNTPIRKRAKAWRRVSRWAKWVSQL